MFDEEECAVRDKYAKRFVKSGDFFQLYTTFTRPGLVSIFFNEDPRSFHNWRLEVGSGRQRGRIREAIDHQINAPVLEIAGNHDGSVYMACPPDPNACINVEMPYVTMLMKDMHGYSSVEFTVLDTLGYSRKICAKNFKSRCTIGELNCEIPMRLSPTWNYACVNLDTILRNAFGTKLTSVQRIQINANARVRRIYFSEELFGYKRLPQEFRIKLSLTPHEKHEIQMYEEFLTNEFNPNERTGKHFPWELPKLYCYPEIHPPHRHGDPLHTMLRRKVKIVELPSEIDPDKYANVKELKSHGETNTGMLRDMLNKSIPPSKLLLPTLSLIYPDKKEEDGGSGQGEKAGDTDSKRKSGSSRKSHVSSAATCGGRGDLYWENLRKIWDEVEVDSSNSQATDWEMINRQNNAGKFTPAELAQYVKYREAVGDYDMFTCTLGNPRFLIPPTNEDDEDDDESEEEESEDISEETEEKDVSLNETFPIDHPPIEEHKKNSNPEVAPPPPEAAPLKISVSAIRALSIFLKNRSAHEIPPPTTEPIVEVLNPTESTESIVELPPPQAHASSTPIIEGRKDSQPERKSKDANPQFINDNSGKEKQHRRSKLEPRLPPSHYYEGKKPPMRTFKLSL